MENRQAFTGESNHPSETHTYIVKGMDCPQCALTLEKGLAGLEGVSAVAVQYTTEKLKITGTALKSEIVSRANELGYEIRTETVQSSSADKKLTFWKYLLAREDARLFFWGLLFILPGLIFTEVMGREHFLIDICSVIALFITGFPVFRSAWKALWVSRTVNINVLMTIAGFGALIIGAYTEAGMVMVLFLLGEIIEGYSAERARNAIHALVELAPQEAVRMYEEGSKPYIERVLVEMLQIGDHILVKPGEKIPMDGTVVKGMSQVNQASITGESRPIDKGIGAQVFAGSINGEGVLEVEVTHLAKDNTISRMIRMVEEAQEKRAVSQKFVDRFASIYTPLIVLTALLAVVIPVLFFNQPLLNPDEHTHGWLYRGLALLVVGCPCALVISTPVSIVSAISNAARHGILIKGGIYLERMNAIKTFVFDKTGTLTEGKPAVVNVRSAGCIGYPLVQSTPSSEMISGHLTRCESCANLLAFASAVENYSEHPLASAMVSRAEQNGLLGRYAASDVTALAGRGVWGNVNGSEILVGSHAYFDEACPHHSDACVLAHRDALAGLTPLLVSKDGDYLGTISVADTLRASSRDAMMQIRQAGVRHLVMLSGDEHEVAKGVAESLALDDFKAGLLPAQKVAALDVIQKQYGPAVMVGDGINDTPALAHADVGIAMGAESGGTAQAMETADITLMSADLRMLAFLVRLSRAAMDTVYFNVFFAIFVKIAFFTLVLAGYGTMWMAVAADMGTTLLVTLNGLRLLRRPVI